MHDSSLSVIVFLIFLGADPPGRISNYLSHASIVEHFDFRTATTHFLEILQLRLLHQKIGYTKQ